MKKNQIIVIVIIGVFLIGALWYFGFRPASQNSYVKINDITVEVEIADDLTEQKTGLSNRESLAAGSGLLFVFEEKKVRSFWMKNMQFAIDIIWIQDDSVVHLSRNLLPEGANPTNQYSSNWPVNYVLEVNAGFVEANQIEVGDGVVIEY